MQLPMYSRWMPIAEHIEPGSVLHTDGAQTYRSGVAGKMYVHDSVNHSAFQWTAFAKSVALSG